MGKSKLSTIKNRVIIITGVSGTGKTTVGVALSERLRVSFYDADSFHPESNITKMSLGIPLTDSDRQPWLQAINNFIAEKLLSETLVVACSALKESYRKLLSTGINPSLISWVHLQGDYDLIYQRMLNREGHFMSADMLKSQLDSYEVPKYGIRVDVDQNLNQLIDFVLKKIRGEEIVSMENDDL